MSELQPQAEVVLKRMLAIANRTKLYRERMDYDYAEHYFIPAARFGRVEFMRLSGGEAFFTWMRPRIPVLLDAHPKINDWAVDNGPFLWIMDVCSDPDINGIALGKAIRARVAHKQLAEPGERVIWWRETGRLGHFIAR